MRILGIIIIIVTIGFLTGYGLLQSGTINLPNSKNTTQTTSTNANNTKIIEETQPISAEDAKIIALEDAKIEPGEVFNLRAKKANYYGTDIYDVEFIADNTEYNYNISVEDGTILAMDYELEDSAYKYLKNNFVSEQEAANLISSKIPGVDKQHFRIKREHDDNRLEYEFHFRHDNITYEAVVDADTGTIIEWKKDCKEKFNQH